MIGREAAMNALRHSQATKIEVEVRYLRDLLRVFVRDNGCGINPETVQRECDPHWGLRGMRERAENISARFAVCSRTGAGTEVHRHSDRRREATTHGWCGHGFATKVGWLASKESNSNLKVSGAMRKQRVDEGSAATPKIGGDILGCRSQ